MIMTWDEAKEAMREGYLVTRLSWAGALVGVGFLDDTDLYNIYWFSSDLESHKCGNLAESYWTLQEKFDDWEIVEVENG